MRQQWMNGSGQEETPALNRKGKRNLLLLALAVAMGASPAAAGLSAEKASAAAPAYKIISQAFKIDGRALSISALNTDNTTYVALRVLSENLGLQTKWDKAKQTVTVTGHGRVLVMNLKTGETRLNDQAIYGLPAIVQDNTTYLPFRFLMERLGYSIGYDAATRGIEVVKIKENDLKIGTVTIAQSDAKKALTLEVNYPQISGLADAAVQKKINDYLKSEAEAHAKYGRETLEEAAKANAEYAADNPGERLLPVSYQGSYYVTYNENGKLSLYVDYYEYTGGAHGGTVRVPYTFDLSTGTLLTLKEAAGNNADYVKIINAAIREGIKKQNLEPLLNPFETIEPDRPFYLNHNGLVVYFEQYEYTPYAAGMPEFVIPLKSFG